MSTVAVDRAPSIDEARAPQRSPLTLRELLIPAFYHWRPALLAFLVPLLLALAVALLVRPVFVAQSRLLILLGSDYVFRDIRNDNGAGANQSFDRAQIIHAETEILSARDLRRQTLQEVGLVRAYPALAGEPNGLDRAEEQFGRDLTIDNVPLSNVIDLKLRNRNPAVAADLLNRLVQNYIVRRRQVFDQTDVGSFQQQRDALNKQLDALEAKLTGVSSAHTFGDYAEALSNAQAQRSALASQLETLDEQIATRGGRAEQLTRRAHDEPSTVELSVDRGRSQQVEALTQSLLALQSQRRDAAAKFQDDYPLVVELDRQIRDLQGQIRASPAQQTALVRRGINPVRQQIDGEAADSDGDVVGLRRGRLQLTAAMQAADARLAELVGVGPQYRELIRQRTVIEGAYQDLAKNAEEAQLQSALTRSHANVRVIQSAEPPLRGHSLRLPLLAAGLVLGLAAALAVIVASAASSQTMLTARDIETKLQTPTLLAVTRGKPEDIRRAKTGLADAPALLQPKYLSFDDGKLLLRLLSSVTPASNQVVQLISADSGAGVSKLALDLAIIASAHHARKVLLVDMEPPADHGAAAVLASRGVELHALPDRGRILQVDDSSLYVSVPFGRHELRAPELDWSIVLAAARKGFDLVVIDSPPLQRSTSGVLISSQADMTLAVIEAGRTRAPVARNLLDRVDAAGGEVIGAILNKRRFYIPRFIYSRL